MVGNPTSLGDLEFRNGHADLLVSVTPEEMTNLTACVLARQSRCASCKVARINNYEYLPATQ